MNTMTSPLIFDRALVHRHVARATASFGKHSALFDDTSTQMMERLSEVKRAFPCALDLSPFPCLHDEAMLITSAQNSLLDEECLSFAPETFDLVISNLALHWVNDVPGALAQIRTTLKPNGMFIASLIGEQSLHELRNCLVDAELVITGGISPRLSPTIDLLTASQLMQRAGFTLPVVDKESVRLLYTDMFALMHDLRGMGQTNAHIQRLRKPTRRAIFFEAARLYQERFSTASGHLPATFDIIYLHGWK